jgi:hypothetical protein
MNHVLDEYFPLHFQGGGKGVVLVTLAASTTVLASRQGGQSL